MVIRGSQPRIEQDTEEQDNESLQLQTETTVNTAPEGIERAHRQQNNW